MGYKSKALCIFASAALLACIAQVGVADAPAADTSDAEYVRDPFWPVGYDPGADARAAAAALAATAKQSVEVHGPVTEAEWKEAKEALPRPSGVFQTRDPATQQQAYKLVIGKRSYFVGDSMFQTNNAVEFVWKVDSITFTPTAYEVSRVSSTRVQKQK